MFYRSATLAVALMTLLTPLAAKAADTADSARVTCTIVAEIGRDSDENVATSTAPRIIESAVPERELFDTLVDATGSVTVAIALDPSGRLITARIIESSGRASLDRGALAAIRGSRFAAETRAGRAVGGNYAVAVVFEPQE